MELTKDIIERIYSIIEDSRTDGRIRKGVNEVTKSLERGEAKLSIVATDVSPSEIIQHLALLAKDKEIMHVEVPSKAELGAAAGLPVATAAVAIANPGEAQKKLNNLLEDIQILMKAEAEPKKEKPAEKEAPKEKPAKVEKPAEKEAPKEEAQAEEKKEEATEEKVEEAPVESEEKTEEVAEEATESKEEAPAEEKAEPEAESKEDKKEEAEEKTE
ncbi:MAG: ribosomal L7Ae/L30e/S12e/Gadd45 family protein [Candidatus Nanoarchaeia archaeon]|jgi:large subunit ribosomal protein L7Ae|nr:ribosomal L7Ae/L30e/S12e/Gadd45 family protein [Candidatus Nanoarchaeia archaeon]